jgi:hypothetical protein
MKRLRKTEETISKNGENGGRLRSANGATLKPRPPGTEPARKTTGGRGMTGGAQGKV